MGGKALRPRAHREGARRRLTPRDQTREPAGSQMKSAHRRHAEWPDHRSRPSMSGSCDWINYVRVPCAIMTNGFLTHRHATWRDQGFPYETASERQRRCAHDGGLVIK